MAKTLTIKEGSMFPAFNGVNRLRTDGDGGRVYWVPKDERPLETLFVMENGTYTANEYGISDVTVSVMSYKMGEVDLDFDGIDDLTVGDMPQFTLTGMDPNLDIPISVGLDDNNFLDFQSLDQTVGYEVEDKGYGLVAVTTGMSWFIDKHIHDGYNGDPVPHRWFKYELYPDESFYPYADPAMQSIHYMFGLFRLKIVAQGPDYGPDNRIAEAEGYKYTVGAIAMGFHHGNSRRRDRTSRFGEVYCVDNTSGMHIVHSSEDHINEQSVYLSSAIDWTIKVGVHLSKFRPCTKRLRIVHNSYNDAESDYGYKTVEFSDCSRFNGTYIVNKDEPIKISDSGIVKGYDIRTEGWPEEDCLIVASTGPDRAEISVRYKVRATYVYEKSGTRADEFYDTETFYVNANTVNYCGLAEEADEKVFEL